MFSLSFEGAPVSAETDKSEWRDVGFELSLGAVRKYLAPRLGYPGQLRCSASDICFDGVSRLFWYCGLLALTLSRTICSVRVTANSPKTE
jgi:hypothetical protein